MTGVFSASFYDAQHGPAMGGDWEDPENNRGNLISTADGGTSWSSIAEGRGQVTARASSTTPNSATKSSVLATSGLT